MRSLVQFNADLGEGAEVEALIMPILSFCNIACGGHTGDKESISKCIQQAKEHQVKIGAHPSYPDIENFGRKVVVMPIESLEESITEQLALIKEIADHLKVPLYHVKAHGALYHQILIDKDVQKAFLNAVNKVLGEKIKIFLPLHICLSDILVDPQRIILEAFGDRKYNDESQLLPRADKGSLLQTADEIYAQIEQLIETSTITTDSDNRLDVRFDTICLHGDHPHLLDYFPKLIQSLHKNNIL